MSDVLATVLVEKANGKGSHRINEKDFDPKVHKKVEPPKAAPAAQEASADSKKK